LQGEVKLDLKTYDRVVSALVRAGKRTAIGDVSRRLGLAEDVVTKIWDGRIARSEIEKFSRLARPKRCPACGALCSEWPCRVCDAKVHWLRESNAP
jgi:hypothetical protein